MARKILRWKYLILGTLLVLLIFSHRLSNNIQIYTKNSAYGVGKFGGKVYFLLLKKLGYKVRMWEEPLSSIEENGCMIVILSPLFPYEKEEISFLKAWVYSGGTLLIADEENNDIFEGFGIISFTVTAIDRDSEVIPIPSEITRNVNSTVLYTDKRLKFGWDQKKEIILVDEKGVIMALVPYGKGKIIATSAPEIFMNEMIQKGNNSILTVNCVSQARGSIYFDEYHHGYKRKKTLFSVLGTPERLFVFQVVCAMLFFLNAVGTRFQTPVSFENEKKKKSIEFVEIMARLYERAGARVYIFSIIFQSFKRRLTKSLGLSADVSLDILVKSMAQEKKVDEKELLLFLRECEGITGKKSITDKKLVAMVLKLDELGKEERGNGK